MNQINDLRQLLEQTKADQSLLPTNKEIAVQMLDSLIRSNELIYRSQAYFDAKFYLGYFLIQGQRTEKFVADIINSAERLRAKKLEIPEKPLKTDVPLGALITLLKEYISGDDVFTPLSNFKDYRNNLVHKLTKDFSKSLDEIESSISTDYHPWKINDLHSILIKIHTEINIGLLACTDVATAKETRKKWEKAISENLGQVSARFQVL